MKRGFDICKKCGSEFIKMSKFHFYCGSSKRTNSGCAYELRKEYKRKLRKQPKGIEANRRRSRKHYQKYKQVIHNVR